MKYFLIAGEASGDLHASNLMRCLQQEDAEADFRYYGGDRMMAVGGECLRHYKEIAYMGFIPVMMHAGVILRAMRECKKAIAQWQPDVVILVDYPGFNLSMARYVKQKLGIPVYYYISPKIWAWKEHRIRQIKENVDELFSILPFEVPFFEQKHGYPIHYVGNPSVDEMEQFKKGYGETYEAFILNHQLENRPVIALLPGSRRQEVKDNLRRMAEAALPYLEKGYQAVVATVADLPQEFYLEHLKGLPTQHLHLLCNATLPLLSHAEAALVTSGTATLETALMRVPQVVCYYAPLRPIVRFLKRKLLHVPYISLPNLIMDREIIPELIADEVNVPNMIRHLQELLRGGTHRNPMLADYEAMVLRLGPDGAPQRAAQEVLHCLRK